MTFEHIANILLSISLLLVTINAALFRRKVYKLFQLQNKLNNFQLEINKLIIGVKEDN